MDTNFDPFNPAYRKYAVVVAALILTVLDAIVPVVPEKYKPWVTVGILVLTALGVKQVANISLPPPVSAPPAAPAAPGPFNPTPPSSR